MGLGQKWIIRNETKGTWIKTVCSDSFTDTTDINEALAYDEEHCAGITVDYLNGTADDCFSLEQR